MPATVPDSVLAILDADPFGANNLTDPYPMHELLRETGPVVIL
jgi:hypothetical protein